MSHLTVIKGGLQDDEIVLRCQDCRNYFKLENSVFINTCSDCFSEGYSNAYASLRKEVSE